MYRSARVIAETEREKIFEEQESADLPLNIPSTDAIIKAISFKRKTIRPKEPEDLTFTVSIIQA